MCKRDINSKSAALDTIKRYTNTQPTKRKFFLKRKHKKRVDQLKK